MDPRNYRNPKKNGSDPAVDQRKPTTEPRPPTMGREEDSGNRGMEESHQGAPMEVLGVEAPGCQQGGNTPHPRGREEEEEQDSSAGHTRCKYFPGEMGCPQKLVFPPQCRYPPHRSRGLSPPKIQRPLLHFSRSFGHHNSKNSVKKQNRLGNRARPDFVSYNQKPDRNPTPSTGPPL